MKKKLLICTFAAGLVIASLGSMLIPSAATKEVGPGITQEAAEMGLLRIWGQVTKVDQEYNRIFLNNQSPNSMQGEMILNISAEQTRVLDAVDGLPVSLDDLEEGETIYAYISPVMTLSLPPITTPSMILCKIPSDFRVPAYVTVDGMEKQEDGSYKLTASDGEAYVVPGDCTILPFLTRNMVYLDFVEKGNTCLVWQGTDNSVNKIVLFTDQ